MVNVNNDNSFKKFEFSIDILETLNQIKSNQLHIYLLLRCLKIILQINKILNNG